MYLGSSAGRDAQALSAMERTNNVRVLIISSCVKIQLL
jgi:hypothetical protein